MNHNSLSIVFDRPQLEGQDVELENSIMAAELNVSSLCIGGTKVTEGVLRCLISKPWDQLETLSLSSTYFDNLACKIFSQGKWQDLKELMLNDNHIQTAGIGHLAKAQMPELQELWLMGNNIGPSGVRQVSKMRCEKMSIIYLDHNRLGLEEIMKIYLWELPEMQICYIFDNSFVSEQETDQRMRKMAHQKFRFMEQYYIS